MGSHAICSVPGCDRPRRARGWCHAHYKRWEDTGDVRASVPLRVLGRPAEERYHEKVERRGPDECWPWLGLRGQNGYGRFYIGTRETYAHRFGYALRFGPIGPGLYVCHRCDNPPCQNPAHWFLGTEAVNSADKVAKGRQMRGERSAQAKLTRLQAEEIRRRHAAGGITQAALAVEFGVSRRAVSKLIAGETWR